MEFPHGHHHHQHGRNDEDSDDFRRPPYPPQPTYGGSYGGGDYPPPQNYPPPPSYGGDFPPPSYGGGNFPPPSYGGGDFAPPPPLVGGVHHASHTPHFDSPNYPPHQPSFTHQPSYGHDEYGAPPPPPPPHLESQKYPPPPQHHHESGGEGGEDGGGHRFRPHMPGFIADHFHHSQSSGDDGSSHKQEYDGGFGGNDLEGYFVNKPTYKVYSKAGDNSYSVAIRDGKVVLAYTDPNDPTQHWYKDEKYSTKVKDEDGYPSFSLVNKSTGQAIKHSVSGHPVQLIPYKPDVLDEAVLWTESKDLGSGFRTIRTVNNVKMVLDAFNGDKDHGGVHDGTVLALYKCWKGDNQNQQWKLYPHSHE